MTFDFEISDMTVESQSLFMKLCQKNKNRIYHRSSMQTEKSTPEGERIMPETSFTEYLAFSVDLRVGISWSASQTDD